MGTVLGVAVLLDAFLVRLVLLPVLLRLTGKAPSSPMQDLRQDHLGRRRPTHAKVKAGVPAAQWCTGGHSKAEKAAATGASSGGSLFGRS